MKILIAGASGFVGQHLVPYLVSEHEISVLGRYLPSLKARFPEHRVLDWGGLQKESARDYDLVINLCGENIGNTRWTEKQKKKLLTSRVQTTEILCEWISASKEPSSLRFLNASAIGIYGLNTSQNTEDTHIEIQANCFSQALVKAWENVVKEKLANTSNYTLMRFGVVLKKHQGMLKKLEIPYKLGMASSLGRGEQLISWVHIDDLVRAISFIIKNPELSGPVNIVAPEVVTQTVFAKTLAQAVHRPYLLKTPAWLIKLLFGKMGEELLLSGQEVTSKRLNHAGYLFHYKTLQDALSNEYL